MNRQQRKHNFGMMLLFTVVVFLSMTVHTLLSAVLAYTLISNDILIVSDTANVEIYQVIEFFSLISLPTGIVLAVMVSATPLRPIRDLTAGMNRLADGDFTTRIIPGPVMKYYPPYVEVAESFNKLAQELENTEMLRSDFINNFSHEFKTPIVSIAGFARLLNRGNLALEQQKEYLSVIEEESMRLSYMATNVLNLTKIENQAILTDVTAFNLSEQIRSCILILENEWLKKDLEFSLEFDEHNIRANEEMLKEVWINLLDNAIKFSSEGGLIRVHILEMAERYLVSVTNYGVDISGEDQRKIWNKFYQADQSHASEGNGVGLAIVKRVAELHKGAVSVSSGGGSTTFSVTLPK